MTGQWQAFEEGVQLFKPAENALSLKTQLSRFSTSRDPSVQSYRQPLAERSANTAPHSRNDSPSTVGNVLSDRSECNTPAAYGSQLQRHTGFGSTSSGHTSDRTDFLLDAPLTPGYASDRTDLLLDDPQTPCPHRNRQDSARQESFATDSSHQTHHSVTRRLDFQPTAIKKKKRNADSLPRKSPAQKALRELHDLCYKKRHNWTLEEKHMLCILYRFYEGRADDITKIFNKIFNLELGIDKIKPMEDYIRRNGALAFPFYGKLLSCSLDDPNHEYATARTIIEEAANSLGVRINRRQIESTQSSGGARKARSEYTRHRFAKLVQKAKYTQHAPQDFDIQQFTCFRLGGIAITNNEVEEIMVGVDGEEEDQNNDGDNNDNDDDDDDDNDNDNDDDDDDDEEPPLGSANVTPQSSYESPRYQPHDVSHLAFRVWDKESRTIFDPERGFVAEGHSIWRGALLSPPAPGSDFFLFTSNSHLNQRHPQASAFISVSTSLIQVLNYATNMIDPQIAVIDLSHPTLQDKYKQTRASKCLKDLKKIGQAYWAKYKGLAEIMIWGEIPLAAVLCHTSLSNVAAKITQETAGGLIFNMADWISNQSVYQLTERLKSRNITLDHDIARAIGNFGKEMGLDDATRQHISEFVQVNVDGWSMQFSDDIHTRASIATSFATSLNHTMLHVQEVIQAFCAGVEHGLENLAFYERRSPRSRRRQG